MKKLRVGVAGATGAVGRTLLSILAERRFPCETVVAFASDRSVGAQVSFGDHTPLTVQDLARCDPASIDVLFMATSSDISQTYVPKLSEAGVWVIDLSSHFRMHHDVPLIVPEVNPDDLNFAATHRIIANPNCVAAPLVMALKPLRDAFGLVRAVVSSYQSVSGRGQKAMDELFGQTRAILVNDPIHREEFEHQIAFNVIPQIDSPAANGITGEEQKVHDETQKILGCRIEVAVTCVRVPVFIGHCMSVALETERDIPLAAAKEALMGMKGLSLARNDTVITPLDCAGEDNVFVCRLRRDPTIGHGVMFWIASDNIRKGAALNAVQIAELLIHHPSFS